MSEEQPLRKKSPYDQFLDLICAACTVFTGVSMVFLTVIFGWLVFGRYVLNATPTWVEQYSLLLIVYIGFLGASIGVHQKTHLGVAVFKEISPRPVQVLFEFLSYSLMTGFGIIMAIYGYKLTVFKWDALIPLINISEGLRALPIMLSGIFIFLFSIGHLIHFFKGSDREKNQ